MSIDATYPQVYLIASLLDYWGLTYQQRYALMRRTAGRNVERIDDLTVQEADALIKSLKALKAQPVKSPR